MPSRERRARALLRQAIADLPDHTYLQEIDVRDSLSDQQVAKLLVGKRDELVEELYDWFLDQGADATNSYLDDVVPDADDRELLGEFDLLGRLEDEIGRRNQSDPLRELMKHTPDPLLRVDLGHDVEPGLSFDGEDALSDAARDLAEAAGIGLVVNRKAIDELLLNASYGGRLKVLVAMDLASLVDALNAGIPQWITFTDPTLLIYDGLNGSGMEAQVRGTVIRPMVASDLCLDAGPYSWSDIVGGISRGNYDTSVEITDLDPAIHQAMVGRAVRRSPRMEEEQAAIERARGHGVPRSPQ
jgi:hypothetical protein